MRKLWLRDRNRPAELCPSRRFRKRNGTWRRSFDRPERSGLVRKLGANQRATEERFTHPPLVSSGRRPDQEQARGFSLRTWSAHTRWTAITVRSSGSSCRDLLQMPYLRRRNQTEDRFLPIQSGGLTRGRSVGAGHGTFNRIRINESRSVDRRTKRDCLVQTPRPVTPNVEFPNLDASFPKAARLHGRKRIKPASVRIRQSPENETEMRYRRGVDRSISFHFTSPRLPSSSSIAVAPSGAFGIIFA